MTVKEFKHEYDYGRRDRCSNCKHLRRRKFLSAPFCRIAVEYGVKGLIPSRFSADTTICSLHEPRKGKQQ